MRKRRVWPKVVLAGMTILVVFLLAEIVFRIAYRGMQIGVDANEICLKEFWRQLPNDQDGRITNFTYHYRNLRIDPLIGLTVMPNTTHADPVELVVPGTQNSRVVPVKKKFLLYREFHHNAQGLSNVESFSARKPLNASVRIAMFGDSFTCGSQVPLLFSFPALLQELIPQSEVLNFCVLSTGIETMYARYLLEGRNYSPDIVVFNVLVDDLARPFGCPVLKPRLTLLNNTMYIGPRQYPTLKDFHEQYRPPVLESYALKSAAYAYSVSSKYREDLQKGLELFGVMIDDVSRVARQDNATFMVSLIQGPNPTPLDAEYYNKLKTLLSKKNVVFFDSLAYFETKRQEYRNQSFWYIEEGQGLGHYSVIGNALHAQGVKKTLERAGLARAGQEYRFTNFENEGALWLIPYQSDVRLLQGKDAGVRVLFPYAELGATKRTYSAQIEV